MTNTSQSSFDGRTFNEAHTFYNRVELLGSGLSGVVLWFTSVCVQERSVFKFVFLCVIRPDPT